MKKATRKMANKYHVIFVADCSPKVKGFKTEAAAVKFIKNFKIDPKNGYWIDYFVAGELVRFWQ